jgi:hypothetical protein
MLINAPCVRIYTRTHRYSTVAGDRAEARHDDASVRATRTVFSRAKTVS